MDIFEVHAWTMLSSREYCCQEIYYIIALVIVEKKALPELVDIHRVMLSMQTYVLYMHGLAGLANTTRLSDQLRHRARGGFLAWNSPAYCQSRGEMASFIYKTMPFLCEGR
jgi:hypothetical protein